MTTHPVSCLNPITVSYPHLQSDSLRRSLSAELAGIRTQITQAGLHDAMTRTIDVWEKNFQKALRTGADPEPLLAVHIALLQSALRDPITNAPLDPEAVLGSDGHTYGRLSLSIYRHRTPAEFHARSPLDPNQPDFTTVPHPVVQYMTRWLQDHHALLHSEELEREYLRILPPQPPASQPSTEERMARLRTERAERQRRAEERQRDLFTALNHQALQSFETALDGMIGSFMERREQAAASVEAHLDHIAAGDQDTSTTLHRQLAEETEQRERAVIDLEQRKQALSQEFTHRTQAIHQQHLAFEEEMRVTADTLNQLIVERASAAIIALREPIESYRMRIESAISSLVGRVEEGHLHLEQEVERMRGEIARLREQNASLRQLQTQVEIQLNVCKEEQDRLQQSINQTQEAIQDLHKHSSDVLFKAIATIGACAFTTWALSVMLSSTVATPTIVPISKGFGVKIMIPI